MLLETNNNSTIENHIYNVLRKHFLEQRPITWKPIKVELIVNTELTDDFFSKYIIEFKLNKIQTHFVFRIRSFFFQIRIYKIQCKYVSQLFLFSMIIVEKRTNDALYYMNNLRIFHVNIRKKNPFNIIFRFI